MGILISGVFVFGPLHRAKVNWAKAMPFHLQLTEVCPAKVEQKVKQFGEVRQLSQFILYFWTLFLAYMQIQWYSWFGGKVGE